MCIDTTIVLRIVRSGPHLRLYDTLLANERLESLWDTVFWPGWMEDGVFLEECQRKHQSIFSKFLLILIVRVATQLPSIYSMAMLNFEGRSA